MILRLALLALSSCLSAQANDYAFPTSPEDYDAFYPTAYKDHGSGSAVTDWSCGDFSYDGHTGNDFGAGSWTGMDEGRDVTASADGIVVAANDGEFDECTSGDCGDANYVKVEHADGRSTLYYHMKQWSVLVSVGEYVSCGQKLGLMGSSGNSFGPHLHFGVVGLDGDAEDPFAGACSTGTDYWVDQGAYEDVPALTCDPNPAVFTPTAALVALAVDDRASTDLDGDGDAEVCLRADDGVRCANGGPTGLSGEFTSTLGAGDGTNSEPPDRFLTMHWGDVNGDRRDDACIRTADAYSCYLSEGAQLSDAPVSSAPGWSDTRGFTAVSQYGTIRMLELDGDGRMDLCARDADGIECVLATPTGFGPAVRGPALSDASGWGDLDNASTIRAGDIDADGKDDLCMRSNSGVICYRSTGAGFEADPVAGPPWSDDDGWNSAVSYGTIRLADLDGDGLADLFGRGPAGIVYALSTGDGFASEQTGPAWSDDSGWDDPVNAFTLRLGDIDGDGDLDLCGRANAGMRCVLWSEGFDGASLVGPEWSDDLGWDGADDAWSIRLADITGDGRADLCGRSADGIVCAVSTGGGFAEPALAGWGADEDGYSGDDNWAAFMAGGPRATGCADADLDGVCDDADACPEGIGAECGDDDGQDLPGRRVPLTDVGCASAVGEALIGPCMAGMIGIVLRRRRRDTPGDGTFM